MVRRGEQTEEEAIGLYRDWRSVDLPPEEVAMLAFVEKLNFTPSLMTEADIEGLRAAGFSDANICDIVALTAYRNFMNRLHDGLGVGLENLRLRLGEEFVATITAPRDGRG